MDPNIHSMLTARLPLSQSPRASASRQPVKCSVAKSHTLKEAAWPTSRHLPVSTKQWKARVRSTSICTQSQLRSKSANHRASQFLAAAIRVRQDLQCPPQQGLLCSQMACLTQINISDCLQRHSNQDPTRSKSTAPLKVLTLTCSPARQPMTKTGGSRPMTVAKGSTARSYISSSKD